MKLRRSLALILAAIMVLSTVLSTPGLELNIKAADTTATYYDNGSFSEGCSAVDFEDPACTYEGYTTLKVAANSETNRVEIPETDFNTYAAKDGKLNITFFNASNVDTLKVFLEANQKTYSTMIPKTIEADKAKSLQTLTMSLSEFKDVNLSKVTGIGVSAKDTSDIYITNVNVTYNNGPAELKWNQDLSAEYEVEKGSEAVLAVEAAGTVAPAYQWFACSDADKNGSVEISGATEATYRVPTGTMGTKYFYCKAAAADTDPKIIESTVAKVQIKSNIKVSFERDLQSEYVVKKDTIQKLEVSAVAAPEGTVTYQWYKNDKASEDGATLLTGETGRSYTLPTSETGTAYYFCKATALDADAVTSTIAAVTVEAVEIDFDTDLDDTEVYTVDKDKELRLNVSAKASDGSAVSYQWFSNTFNGTEGATAIAGATTGELIVPTASAGQFYYFCEVSAKGAELTDSKVASVEVKLPLEKKEIVIFKDEFNKDVVAENNNWIEKDKKLQNKEKAYATVLFKNSVGAMTGAGAENVTIECDTNTANASLDFFVIDKKKDADSRVNVSVTTDEKGHVIADLSALTEPAFDAQWGFGIECDDALLFKNIKLLYEVIPQPVITIKAQPFGDVIPVGGANLTLTCDAVVDRPITPSYQWFVNDKEDTEGAVAIEGATNSDFEVAADQVGVRYYFCVVSAAGAKNEISDFAKVEIKDGYVISIIEQPVAAQSVKIGDTVTLSATGSVLPDEAVSYQWYACDDLDKTNERAIEGATEQTYTFVADQADVQFYFVRVMANEAADKDSDVSKVVVENPITETITISDEPQDVKAEVGQDAVLTVGAAVTDGSVEYQWYAVQNGMATAIEGANEASYTVNQAEAGNYYYFCTLSATGAQSVDSRTAQVAVGTADNTEISIDVQPEDQTVMIGTTAELDVDASVNADKELNYQWYTCQNEEMADAAELADETDAALQVDVEKEGTEFFFCVVSAPGIESKVSDVATIVASPKPVITITTQPESQTVGIGDDALLSVVASCDSEVINYQWYENTVEQVAGATELDGEVGETYDAPTASEGTKYYFCELKTANSDLVRTDIVSVNVQNIVKKAVVLFDDDFDTENVSRSGLFTVDGGVLKVGGGYNYICYTDNVDQLVGSKADNVCLEFDTNKYSKKILDKIRWINTKDSQGSHNEYTMEIFADASGHVKLPLGNIAAPALDSNYGFGFVSYDTNFTLDNVKITYTESEAPVIKITEQPKNEIVRPSKKATLSVKASVEPLVSLKYQWYECDDVDKTNATPVSGATSRTFDYTSSDIGQHYFFVRVLADGAKTKESNVAFVSVKLPTPEPDYGTIIFDDLFSSKVDENSLVNGSREVLESDNAVLQTKGWNSQLRFNFKRAQDWTEALENEGKITLSASALTWIDENVGADLIVTLFTEDGEYQCAANVEKKETWYDLTYMLEDFNIEDASAITGMGFSIATTTAQIDDIVMSYEEPDPSKPQIIIKKQPSLYDSIEKGKTAKLYASGVSSDGSKVSYQWYSCDNASRKNPVEISGETGKTFYPSTAEVGKKFYFCKLSASGARSKSTVVSTLKVINPVKDKNFYYFDEDFNGKHEPGDDAGSKRTSATAVKGTYSWQISNNWQKNKILPENVPAITTYDADQIYVKFYVKLGKYVRGGRVDVSIGNKVSGVNYLSTVSVNPDMNNTGWQSFVIPISAFGDAVHEWNPELTRELDIENITTFAINNATWGAPEGKKSTIYVDEARIAWGDKAAPTITITKQPKSSTMKAGSKKTLSVSAKISDGLKLNYQWYKAKNASKKGAKLIKGATQKSYTISPEKAGKQYYFCRLSEDGGTKKDTKVATLTVNGKAVVQQYVIFDDDWSSMIGQVMNFSKVTSGNNTYLKVDQANALAKCHFGNGNQPIDLREAYDSNGYVFFKVKASEATDMKVRLGIHTYMDWTLPQSEVKWSIDTPNEWTEVKIPLSLFKYDTEGNKVDFSKIYGFGIVPGMTESLRIYVDDIKIVWAQPYDGSSVKVSAHVKDTIVPVGGSEVINCDVKCVPERLACTYQWYSCNANGSNRKAISGATSSSYQVSASSVGYKYFVCEVRSDFKKTLSNVGSAHVVSHYDQYTNPANYAGDRHFRPIFGDYYIADNGNGVALQNEGDAVVAHLGMNENGQYSSSFMLKAETVEGHTWKSVINTGSAHERGSYGLKLRVRLPQGFDPGQAASYNVSLINKAEGKDASGNPFKEWDRISTAVSLREYIDPYNTGWQDVTIPFSDFAENGEYWSNDLHRSVQTTFDWTKIIGIGFSQGNRVNLSPDADLLVDGITVVTASGDGSVIMLFQDRFNGSFSSSIAGQKASDVIIPGAGVNGSNGWKVGTYQNARVQLPGAGKNLSNALSTGSVKFDINVLNDSSWDGTSLKITFKSGYTIYCSMASIKGYYDPYLLNTWQSVSVPLSIFPQEACKLWSTTPEPGMNMDWTKVNGLSFQLGRNQGNEVMLDNVRFDLTDAASTWRPVKSRWVYTREVITAKEELKSDRMVFDDDFVNSKPSSKTSPVVYTGDKHSGSASMDVPQDDKSRFYGTVLLNPKMCLKSKVSSHSALRFWVKIPCDANYSLGLTNDYYDIEPWAVASTSVSLKNYIDIKKIGEWQEVIIPLDDFSKKGSYWSNSAHKLIDTEIDFEDINGITFSGQNVTGGSLSGKLLFDDIYFDTNFKVDNSGITEDLKDGAKVLKVVYGDTFGKNKIFGYGKNNIQIDFNKKLAKVGKAYYKQNMPWQGTALYVLFDKTIDLSPEEYQDKVAVEMWVRLHGSPGWYQCYLTNDYDGEDVTPARINVSMLDFVDKTIIGEWQKVTIPLSYFSEDGTWPDENGVLKSVPFDLSKVNGFGLNHTAGKEEPTEPLCDYDDIKITYNNVADKTFGVQIIPKEEFDAKNIQFNKLDISEFMTTSYSDDVESDGTGGWSDQGSTNDASSFDLIGDQVLESVPLHFVDPASNNDKSVIALRKNFGGLFTDEVEIPINDKIDGVYMAHTMVYEAFHPADYSYVYKDGTEETVEIKKNMQIYNWWGNSESEAVRCIWTGQNAAAEAYGKGVSITMFPFVNPHPEKEVKCIRCTSTSEDACCMILAMTTCKCDDGGVYLPIRESIYNPDMSDWYPYQQPDYNKMVGTALDVSYVLDAPAGKHGFVVADGDDWAFEDGTKTGFWGTNVTTTATFGTKEQIDTLVNALKSAGMNMVRLMDIDASFYKPNVFGWSTDYMEPDPESMDAMCYLIAKCKENGIYIKYCTLGGRTPSEALGHPAFEDLGTAFKTEIYFDDLCVDYAKALVQKILQWKNPYTGMTLAEDPVLACVEVNNESNLMSFGRMTGENYEIKTDYEKKLFNDQFNAYLKEMYGDNDALMLAWEQEGRVGLREGENLDKGTVIMDEEYLNSNFSRQRLADSFRYLYTLSYNMHSKYIKWLKEDMGIKVPCTGTNNLPSQDRMDNYENSHYDYLDRHDYISHPSNGTDFRKGTFTGSARSILLKPVGFLQIVPGRRTMGIPFMESEMDETEPNMFISEFNLAAAAMFSYQGLSGTAFPFIAEDVIINPEERQNSIHDVFQTMNHPLRFGTLPSGSLLYHRNEIQQSEVGYYTPYTEADALNPSAQNTAIPDGAEWVGRAGLIFKGEDGKSITGSEPESDYTILEKINHQVLVNEGGEMMLQKGLNDDDGIAYYNTDQTQAAIGRYDESGIVKLSDVEIDSNNYFANICVSALGTEDSIADADGLLVTAAARARNTGMEVSADGNTVVKRGKAPILVEQVEGTVTIKNTNDYDIYILNSTGERIGDAAQTKDERGYTVLEMKLGDESMHYEFVKVADGKKAKAAKAAEGEDAITYADVDEEVRPAYEAMGIDSMAPVTDELFGGQFPLERDEFVAALVRSFDLQPVEGSIDKYGDIEEDNPNYDDLVTAKQNNVVEGTRLEAYELVDQDFAYKALYNTLVAAGKADPDMDPKEALVKAEIISEEDAEAIESEETTASEEDGEAETSEETTAAEEAAGADAEAEKAAKAKKKDLTINDYMNREDAVILIAAAKGVKVESRDSSLDDGNGVNIPLILGCSVGGAAVLAGIIALLIALRKRKIK